MIIETEYNIGDIVFLRTDKEQLPRIITKITVTAGGIIYCIANSTIETYHYDIEIAEEINVLLKMNYD